jgi:hypothetical protein
VFVASNDQNGVTGFILGGMGNQWTGNESPAGGISVTAALTVSLGGQASLTEYIVLGSLIPAEFAD